MPVVTWIAWKKTVVGSRYGFICTSCRKPTPLPHKCKCGYKTSQHPEDAITFVKKNRVLYPVFELMDPPIDE